MANQQKWYRPMQGFFKEMLDCTSPLPSPPPPFPSFPPPFPFHPSPLPFPPFPLPPLSPPLPFPSPPFPALRSRPPYCGYGLGERFSYPSGSGRSPAAKRY